MLGNLPLGWSALGTVLAETEDELRPAVIIIGGQLVAVNIFQASEIGGFASMQMDGFAPTRSIRKHCGNAEMQISTADAECAMRTQKYINEVIQIEITSEPVEKRLRCWYEADTADLAVEAISEGLTSRQYIGIPIYNTSGIELVSHAITSFTTQCEPTIQQYENAMSLTSRRPVYKIEFLRPEDETPYLNVTGDVICDSGSVTVEKQDGVRRTSSFELSNIGNKYNEFVEHITIGSKYRVLLGEEINGNIIYFRKGTYLCDDPSLHGTNNDRKVSISGTDKWSVLNGQHGGILEGTYTVEKGSKLGDFVRRTLRLNIVNDPIEPLIHQDLEDLEITYDITKGEGGSISDVFLDVALNLNCSMYYDEFGRFCVMPIDEANNKTVIRRFAPGDNVYIGASKTYNNEKIYNSVLVVGENAQNTETPVRYELINEDKDDPNSVPNVGIKKVYKVSDYTAGIDTEEKAQWRAIYEMRNIKEKFYAATADFVDILYLDVDQLIELTDDEVASNKERYIITALTHKIGVDMSTSATVSKVSS